MQNAPDGWFYYAVTLAFGGALIFVILRYTGKIDTTLTRLEGAVNQLTTMTRIHEHQISETQKQVAKNSDEIEALRDFYVVTYKK